MSTRPGFAYLLAHPTAVSLSVAHSAALLLLLALPFFVRWARRDYARHRTGLLCRLAAFVLLDLALAGLALSVRVPSDRLSLVAAVDVSQSIGTAGRIWQARYLDAIASALAPGDELGVVAFGKTAAVVKAPGPPGPADVDRVSVSTTATDVAQGLAAAMALLPPDGERRLLLLTDGNETRGHSGAEIPRAQRANVAIYAAVPPHSRGFDVAVEKLAVAPLVVEGGIFPVRITLRNTAAARPATLRLLVNGEVVASENLTLRAGLSAVEIPHRLHGAGSHRVRAEVAAAGDAVAGNDYRETAVMVGGKSRILLVTARPPSPLATALERTAASVSTITPGNLPTDVEHLLGTHAVVLQEITARMVTAPALATLERYVRDFAGALLVVGGTRTFADLDFKTTALERLLPVTVERQRPRRTARRPLALFLLLDRSNSMGYHVRSRLERSASESKLAYAKRAALAVVAQLKDTDMVGLIAFDSQPFEVAPLRPLKDNRTLLEANVPRLQPGGGTDFHDALESARQQLSLPSDATRHIILLTDGDTNRAASDHTPLIAALAEANLSVTTIRIGEDTVNVSLLRDISSRTGGQFYHTANARDLPELLLQDTHAALGPSGHEDVWLPRLAAGSQALRGFAPTDLPTLGGYARTRTKPGADMLLSIGRQEQQDPLLTVWQYGLGRVGAFTASLEDAAAWIGWDGFSKFWSQVVHWAARAHTPWDYALDVRRVDGRTTVTVRSFDDLDDSMLRARLFVSPEQPVDVTLVPHAPRQFVGTLPAVPGGRYPLTVTTRRGRDEVTQRTTTVLIPARDEEPQEEFEHDRPNLALLQHLTSATGGAVDAPIEMLVGRALSTRRVVHALEWLLVPLAMLLFVVDVGLRRLARV